MEHSKEFSAFEYFRAKKRMTNDCIPSSCELCSLGFGSNKKVGCTRFEVLYPEEAIAIVQKWAEENPEKTALTDFKEKYPNAELTKQGYPPVCMYSLGYDMKRPQTCYGWDKTLSVVCLACWERPLEVE